MRAVLSFMRRGRDFPGGLGNGTARWKKKTADRLAFLQVIGGKICGAKGLMFSAGIWYDSYMDKNERKQLEKEFIRHLKEDLKNASREKWMAIIYLLAFLSMISAIAAVIWLG